MATTTQHPGAAHDAGGPIPPERVLLATDGGLAAVSATRWLADRGTRRALEVDVVEVVEVHPADISGATEASIRDATIATGRVQELLEHLGPRIPVRAEVLRGEVIPTLHRSAEAADLVVVGGTRVPRGEPHLTTGFATRLAAGCPRPLVVVPRGWEPSTGPVVVGTEGDAGDDAAVEFAAAEAKALGRRLVLVHAWRLAAASAPAYAVDLDAKALEDAASARLGEVVEDIRRRHPGLRVAPVPRHDEPVHALEAAEHGAVLMVLGTHGLASIDRLLLRSVSKAVIERPGCPVAIVPPAPRG